MSGTFAISVIDDDDSFRLALVGSLRSLGYDVLGFASVEEFLAAGGARLSDSVITDLHMPGMSGIDLIQKLRAQDSTLPVILITGRAEAGLQAKAAAAGAVCLLSKPFEMDALIDGLAKALKI